MAPTGYLDVQPSATASSLAAVAERMFSLMLRNLATDDLVFVDPGANGSVSAPGCTLASPTYPYPPVPAGAGGPQDYLFNWVRDAAIAALELAAPEAPLRDTERAQRLRDYVGFARLCQEHPADDGRWDDFARACFSVEGLPRDWGNQSDGPALQTLALLGGFPYLDAATRSIALDVITANVEFLLIAYQRPTLNLWEEEVGQSFFARAVQLKCFEAVRDNGVGLAKPPGVDAAIAWLHDALSRHWDPGRRCYLSFETPWEPNPDNQHDPYDPNIDIVLAALYGTVPADGTPEPFLNPRLLATAGALRNTWTGTDRAYPINADDDRRGFGPLLGRYPSDYYDGDTNDPRTPGHPWVLASSALAELYYRVAAAITTAGVVPADPLASDFLTQVSTGAQDPPATAASALRGAGERILRGLIFHSDNLELSEQLDRSSGFERSLANLTWSYASFLSAVRAAG